MDARRVDKDYLASSGASRRRCEARSTWRSTAIRGIASHHRHRPRGQPSVTQYERLSTTGEFSLVRCRLITGRTHQIRVHLSAKKWPIVGDVAYGPKRVDANAVDTAVKFPRQALHSWRIAFRQPRTGRELAIEAPLPPT